MIIRSSTAWTIKISRIVIRSSASLVRGGWRAVRAEIVVHRTSSTSSNASIEVRRRRSPMISAMNSSAHRIVVLLLLMLLVMWVMRVWVVRGRGTVSSRIRRGLDVRRGRLDRVRRGEVRRRAVRLRQGQGGDARRWRLSARIITFIRRRDRRFVRCILFDFQRISIGTRTIVIIRGRRRRKRILWRLRRGGRIVLVVEGVAGNFGNRDGQRHRRVRARRRWTSGSRVHSILLRHQRRNRRRRLFTCRRTFLRMIAARRRLVRRSLMMDFSLF